MIKKLLLKRLLKRRRPKFLRAEYFKHKRLKKCWRRPRGRKSWIRREKKGRQVMPNIGYRSPRIVRGLNRYGKKEIVVNNISDVKKVNPKTEVIVIASSVGKKKRILIEEEAIKRGIEVINSRF